MSNPKASFHTGNLYISDPEGGADDFHDDKRQNALIYDFRLMGLNNYVLDGLAVTAGSGLTVNWAAGSASVGGTDYKGIAASSGSATDNTANPYIDKANFVYVNSSGVVTMGTSLPSGEYCPLAIVHTDSGAIVKVVDIRRMVPDSISGFRTKLMKRCITIDEPNQVGWHVSTAIDSRNNVHMSYYDVTNGDLKYVTNADGSWSTPVTVDAMGASNYYGTSIAIDSSDNVHISYYYITSNDLKYATNASGSWVASTLDSTGDVGRNSCIGIDSNDKVHISYGDTTNGTLKYATNKTGSWAYSTVVSSIGATTTSLGIDSSDKIHISYYDATNADLEYVTDATGSWVSTVIDSTGNVGQYNSIAIDSNEKIHISYEDTSNFDLKYATNASGSWVASTLDSIGSVGSYNSIGMDSGDNIYISYHDSSNTNLKLAVNRIATWTLYDIDTVGSTGQFTFIKIDTNDHCHIGYYSSTKTSLDYAHVFWGLS